MVLKKRGLLIVVSGPSGAGKGTICKKYLETNKNVKLSVSATTRSPRVGEIEGKSYYFKTKEEFENMIANYEFLEYAKIYDNYYGTPRKTIFEELNNGNDVILEIEMQGAKQIKCAYPEAVFVFILPPSLTELRNRIVGRGTETSEQIEKRFNSALNEIKLIEDYDFFIFNNVVEKSVEDLETIVHTEKMKVIRYKNEIMKIFEKENE